jgi:hypothetical protein
MSKDEPMSPPKSQPADASLAPRYTGVRTFAGLPSVAVPHVDVDAAVIGVPFDTATSFRSGTRFGPEAIRSASALLRPYHPPLDVDVFGTLSIVDGGDVEIAPGNALQTTEQIAAALEPVVAAGIARSCSAATTRSWSASCARTPRSTARSRSCSSTRTPTHGTPTAARSTSTGRRSGARSRRLRHRVP